MTPQQPPAITFLLIAGIIIVTCLLVWSVSQTAAIKVESLASAARIAELGGQVDALGEELASVKIRLAMANSVIDQKNTQIGPLPEADFHIANTIEEHGLDDMANPQQESPGVTDGRQAFAELNYDSAIENFIKVETTAADYVAARMGVANAYFYSQRYSKAVAEFAHVLEQQPDSAEAAVGLANAYHRLGQRKQQIAAYDKVISIEPQQWLHYNSRATAYLMDDNHERAIEDFQQAARLASPVKADQATASENIGLIYLREQQWQLAFEHANEVNRLDVKHAWNWLIRGIAAAKMERNVDAYVSFDKWFKYKRATDPYLLKQFLPESIHAYIDVSPVALTKLVDPPLISGQVCANDFQCKSYACRPGAPFNKTNYCVAADKLCSAMDSNGYLAGETLVIDEIKVRCYQPESGNARWTPDNRVGQ